MEKTAALSLPATAALPLPAATLVLLRDAAAGPEVLLLRRSRATRFAPGAYVFPGGRVDSADGDDAMARLWHGLDAEAARVRLELPAGSRPSALAYYGAAVRETFEETGILACASVTGVDAEGKADAVGNATARTALLEDGRSFAATLEHLGARLSGAALEYVAHWVTPADSPRRYDTRFFAARAPAGARVVPDGQEIAGALWLSPSDALARSGEGRLPLMRPTVRTLDAMRSFPTVAALLAFWRGRPVPRIQPERTRGFAGSPADPPADPPSTAGLSP